MKKVLIFVLILVVISTAWILVSKRKVTNIQEENVACTLEAKICPDGSYVGRTGPSCEFEKCPEVTSSDHSDLIKVSSPAAGAVVASPLVVKGEARGNWYFEASFPVRLFDADGKELAVSPAQAQGEWMTTNFVPFEVTLTFDQPTTTTGTLVLEKDNASGLPEHDDHISIPVSFTN